VSAFKRPQTAQQAVLVELRRQILAGELAPGSQIVQDTIAERLGLSRVPVREALKILEGEGQVTYHAHHGYYVTKLDIDELLETYRIRALLEADCVRVAVPRLGPEDLARMAAALDDMTATARSERLVAFSAANRRFHFALLEPSGMTRMVKIIRQLWDATEPYRSLYFADPRHRDVVDAEHREILRATRERDTGRLNELLDEHRQHALDDLVLILERMS
jgi:DNA-binding GntR family transcriptional regulator